MAQPETRTIDTLHRIDAAFPRLRPAGQRPEIRATYQLFPSSPPGEWHLAIPNREPLQGRGRYSRAIADSKILLYHPANYTTQVWGSCRAGSVRRWPVRFGQIWGGGVSQVQPVVLKKEDRARHPFAVGLDQTGDIRQDFGQGCIEEDQLQCIEPRLARQCLLEGQRRCRR